MKSKKILFALAYTLVLILLIALFTRSYNESVAIPAVHDVSQGAAVSDVFTSDIFGFTIKPSQGFRVDETYLNQTLGPGKEIPGVAFYIPARLTDGTNLSNDSYLSVEKLSDVDCEPQSFLDGRELNDTKSVVFGDNSFTKLTASDAGAGNFYTNTVYVTAHADACYAVRTSVHTTNINNYDPGTIKLYDEAALQTMFDSMIESLILK